MKRKDFENAFDDFARKSRRLDCELAPVIDEEISSGIAMLPEQVFLQESPFAGAADLVPNESHLMSPLVVANDPPSQELAIVLYNPESAATQGMVKSPNLSNFQAEILVMNPEILSGWKSRMLRQGNQRWLTITELDEESDEYKSSQSNNSMSIVPRVASQQQPYVTLPESEAPDTSIEPMEADADCEMMEFDDNSISPSYNNQVFHMNNGIMAGAQTTFPLQQSHCLMPPQYATNTYSPIPWYS